MKLFLKITDENKLDFLDNEKARHLFMTIFGLATLHFAEKAWKSEKRKYGAFVLHAFLYCLMVLVFWFW